MKSESIAPPDWISDLVGLWASRDIRSETARMGYGSTSPMFRDAVSSEEDADHSYSSDELTALGSAMERLKAERPAEWAAVHHWLRLSQAARGAALMQPSPLRLALSRVAAWVDEEMGD